MVDEKLEQLMKDITGSPKKKPGVPIMHGMAKHPYDFPKRKREARLAAYELGYGKDILEKIENAKTEGEITRALAAGRHMMAEHAVSDIYKEKVKSKRKNRKAHNREQSL